MKIGGSSQFRDAANQPRAAEHALQRGLQELAKYLDMERTYQIRLSADVVSIGSPRIYYEYRLTIQLEEDRTELNWPDFGGRP
jgi:hypothetical protein